ncbi:MAG: hypothetical protein ACE5I3_01430 [Phycisphaerae bacterium]
MEARSSTMAVYLSCLLAIAGCPMQNGKPAARPKETDNRPREEHSEVVKAGLIDDVQPAADVEANMEEVRQWIERIQRRDDVRSRLGPPPSSGTLTPESEDSYQPKTGESEAPPESPQALERPDPQQGELSIPEPPVLGSISVRAARSPTPATTPRRETAPSVNAPAEAADQPLTLAEFLERWTVPANDPSFRNQLDQRLLQTLAGNYEDARQPLELVSNAQRLMATQFIEALIAIREGHGGEPRAEANRVLAQLEHLQESLLPMSDLHIPRLALTRAVRGYGRYEAFDPPHFPTGRENEFVVYCEVENFLSRLRDDGEFESQFSMRTAVLNRAGDVVLEINDEHIADECRTRRHDCFIPRLVRLPATLSPGEYVVKVTIIDKIGQKVAERRTTFRILARS